MYFSPLSWLSFRKRKKINVCNFPTDEEKKLLIIIESLLVYSASFKFKWTESHWLTRFLFFSHFFSRSKKKKKSRRVEIIRPLGVANSGCKVFRAKLVRVGWMLFWKIKKEREKKPLGLIPPKPYWNSFHFSLSSISIHSFSHLPGSLTLSLTLSFSQFVHEGFHRIVEFEAW